MGALSWQGARQTTNQETASNGHGPSGYAPALLLYIDGKFVGLKEFSPPEANFVQCMEEAQRETVAVLEGATGAGHTYAAIGACIPVPAASVAKAVKTVPEGQEQQQQENPNLTHSDGRQTI